MTKGNIPTDEEIISVSDKLIDDLMIILKKFPEEKFRIPEEDWPKGIRSLSPLSVLVDSEGLYIITKETFVDVWGVFIPREDSERKTTMPSYNRVMKGIYRFYAG